LSSYHALINCRKKITFVRVTLIKIIYLFPHILWHWLGIFSAEINLLNVQDLVRWWLRWVLWQFLQLSVFCGYFVNKIFCKEIQRCCFASFKYNIHKISSKWLSKPFNKTFKPFDFFINKDQRIQSTLISCKVVLSCLNIFDLLIRHRHLSKIV